MNDVDDVSDGVERDDKNLVAECPYCGEVFEDVVEEGVHRAEEHMNEDSIPRKREKNDSSLIDEWSEE